MKKLLLLLLLPSGVFGMDRFAALSMIESGDDDQAIGRAGEISRFQIRITQWESVTNSSNYSDFETARTVARRIMEERVRTFESVTGHAPTDFDFYALWNAPRQALEKRVSPMVAERCQRFANLCERDRQLAQLDRR
jgi:hypothetical protein